MTTKSIAVVTGGAGFIGSCLVRQVLRETDLQVVVLDKLTYAGNVESLADYDGDSRLEFIEGDICDPELVTSLLSKHQPMGIIHLAAESHVDRSIDGPAVFLQTNVQGTFNLLESCLAHWQDLDSSAADAFRFLHVSTDEVYGSLGAEGLFSESSPYQPSSPYSASKAASDHFVQAFHHTYGFPTLLTNCSNNYGPYQFPEKLIPLMVSNALKGEPLPVYGDGLNVRDWIYVRDHCRGLDAALHKGRAGEAYNFGGDAERTNLQIVKAILEQTGADAGLITFVEDRLGHDRRYAVDATKAKKELSWAPLVEFGEGLAETIAWYGENGAWLERIESGAYRV